MGSNCGNHGHKVYAWRSWCKVCQAHLAMAGHHSLWPDEIRCPACKRWCKVLAVARHHLKGDIICPPGSGRNRVTE